MESFVVSLTDDSFDQEVVACEQPVLVDFYTPNCPPCKHMAPIIDELSVEFQGQVKVCKMNAEDHMRTAMRFGLRAVPTMIIFRNGQPLASLTGQQAKDRLVAELTRVAG